MYLSSFYNIPKQKNKTYWTIWKFVIKKNAKGEPSS